MTPRMFLPARKSSTATHRDAVPRLDPRHVQGDAHAGGNPARQQADDGEGDRFGDRDQVVLGYDRILAEGGQPRAGGDVLPGCAVDPVRAVGSDSREARAGPVLKRIDTRLTWVFPSTAGSPWPLQRPLFFRPPNGIDGVINRAVLPQTLPASSPSAIRNMVPVSRVQTIALSRYSTSFARRSASSSPSKPLATSGGGQAPPIPLRGARLLDGEIDHGPVGLIDDSDHLFGRRVDELANGTRARVDERIANEGPYGPAEPGSDGLRASAHGKARGHIYGSLPAKSSMGHSRPNLGKFSTVYDILFALACPGNAPGNGFQPRCSLRLALTCPRVRWLPSCPICPAGAIGS